MRRFSYIFVLFAALLCGCNDNTIDSGDEQIVVPTKPYIYLDAAVNTRASLINGTTLNGNFSVFGYTYDFNNKWSTYRVTAKPNVFDNVPQNVTFNRPTGSYQYSPIKEWQGGKYTFFAFYPQTVNSSGANVEGTPYLTYAPDFNDAGSHIDIMTAMFEDTSLSSSPYVYFDFYHRLSAVDVVAMNFYEYSYPESENTVITEKITIEIVDLALQFENVQYKEAKIYLDRRIPSECILADAGTNPFYQIISEEDESGVFINYNEDSTLRPITATLRSSMIFIPQVSPDLKVSTTVSFMKRRPNGEYIPVTIKNDKGEDEIVKDENGNIVYVFTQTIETPFNQALKEGSRYYLQMTFTSAGVSISIITSDEWDDIKVDYEFE